MKFKIEKYYEPELKKLINSFNKGLISFDEMCELNLVVVDKINIESLKEYNDWFGKEDEWYK